MKKGQFKIYIDPELLVRVRKLDWILNRYKGRDRHGNIRDNINMSEYWEGVIKEHMGSREVKDLMRAIDTMVNGDSDLE